MEDSPLRPSRYLGVRAPLRGVAAISGTGLPPADNKQDLAKLNLDLSLQPCGAQDDLFKTEDGFFWLEQESKIRFNSATLPLTQWFRSESDFKKE